MIPTAHPNNRKKKMDIKHGRKTSFDIDYVDVTVENIQEVADWCGGTVIGTGSGIYIQIADKSAMNSRQTKAYVNDVMTKHLGLGTFRAFSRKAFEKAYHEIVPGDVQEDDRSSVTGQYVTHAEAEEHPDTTVHETVHAADAGLGEK